MGNPADHLVLDSAAAGSGCTVYRLDITQASSSITLAPGGYRLYLEGTIPAVLRVGNAASVPASTASADGFYVAPGAYVPLWLPTGGALHGILTSVGTSSLWASRVVL